MTMTTDDELREISERIARLVRDAYKRGEADAIDRLLRAARSSDDDTAQEAVNGHDLSGEEASRKRAPKGAAGQLIDRALQGSGGMTPAEIKERAADDHERMISVASIRANLRLGRAAGRYLERSGRWYPAPAAVEKQKTADPAEGQAVSGLWSNQEDHH